MRVPQVIWLVPLAFLIGFGGVVGFFLGEEIRTSKLQAEYLTDIAAKVHYEVKAGPAQDFRVPSSGPYNQRLGYSYIPFFAKALQGDGYAVTQQVRASAKYHELIKDGLYPLYRPKNVAGLDLKDRNGEALYKASFPSNVFPSFEAIPPLLVDTLLYIENRELLKDGPVTHNPAIEWDRFFYAAFGQILKHIIPGQNFGGGSTLATQIEKFRFSPGGQTHGAMEKIRQIVSASLRVYMNGPDTREARKQIVLDYLNSTPLSARPGFGEINSIGDGLWAWFGHDLKETTTALNLPETDVETLRVKGAAYREVLGLILSQRRPTYYLLSDRMALDALTDSTLDLLARANVISVALRNAARATKFRFLPDPPPVPQVDFLDMKATNAMRTHLLKKLGLRNMYELDRVDVDVTSTLDSKTQKELTGFLKKMADPEHLKSIGLYGFRLLKEDNDPAEIKWSVLLYEKKEDGNYLRVQSDNINSPLDMNEGGKLDLGSTAKLRTLVTYLEIVGELYRRYAGLSSEDLKALTNEAPDVLTLWTTEWLSEHPKATMEEMLQAAMDRKYSGSPWETFFTGGGAHQFVNFDKSEDHKNMNLREALRDSVNLVFIRLMRDIVNYTIGQGQQTKQELLGDPEHPARKAYLERFADKEGTTFLNRYISDYAKLDPSEILTKLAARAHKGATSQAILYRSAFPKTSYQDFAAFMKKAVPTPLGEERLHQLYDEYPVDRYSLADRGYITGINPLELWLVSYKLANPRATRSQILAISKPVRIESYAWLFRASKKGAQDTRIRILLEQDAFAHIQQRWSRLGYPFDRLVPSFATSIGSSADRPGALAELVGILLNDGVRKPMVRFEKLRFAQGTPFETELEIEKNRGERVLEPAVARVARAAMIEVVENGTARRLRGGYVDHNGVPLIIGGKTGTGDHRFDEYGPHGRLISSRVVNRTGTIVFYIGDRFFGTVTAHVAGQKAENFKFTSALSAQVLRSLAPILQPLIIGPKPEEPKVPETQSATEAVKEQGHQTDNKVEPALEAPAVSSGSVQDGQAGSSASEAPKLKKKAVPASKPATSYDLMMDVLPQ
jgi:membrane peptidoglycan carboxypeptidase